MNKPRHNYKQTHEQSWLPQLGLSVMQSYIINPKQHIVFLKEANKHESKRIEHISLDYRN